jgi:hypothetical protein
MNTADSSGRVAVVLSSISKQQSSIDANNEERHSGMRPTLGMPKGKMCTC